MSLKVFVVNAWEHPDYPFEKTITKDVIFEDVRKLFPKHDLPTTADVDSVDLNGTPSKVYTFNTEKDPERYLLVILTFDNINVSAFYTPEFLEFSKKTGIDQFKRADLVTVGSRVAILCEYS